nr:tetratricopeptide repeat protein [Marinobacter aromaticivorans]
MTGFETLFPGKTGPGVATGFVTAAAVCLSFMLSAPTAVADAAPQRAKDPMYGWVLYNYHQGEALEALTLLDVARERGSIRGHGAYPELVEGGLMLSYGMVREARSFFTRLLEDGGTGDVSDGKSRGIELAPDVRNQAWFYLGKVLYLEGEFDSAYENLQRVNAGLLEESDAQLYAEWLYLNARLAMASPEFGDDALIDSLLERLKHSGPWQYYLRYNIAMADISAGESAAAQQGLITLIADMEDESPGEELIAEHRALLDKSRLSLARMHLREARFDEAAALLGTMPLDSVFADRTLFDYVLAAAGQGEMHKALDALDTLSRRNLFLPWREQLPYARGYLLEKTNRPREALGAFTRAAEHYDVRSKELTSARKALTEDKLMARLSFLRDSGEMITDAYGRLRVTPTDFGLSEVLAAEPFQQALGELHELYRMQALLLQREEQLSTFETMLETRRMQRERRSREARFELEQQQADDCAKAHESFRTEIEAALEREDAEFFMTSGQKALKARLDKVADTLAQLPDDERTARQRKTYQRMKAYFDWTLANDYGINRWAAQKQLRELDREMAQFRNQRAAIEALMAADEEHNELSRRLARNVEELQELKQQVHEASEQARSILMGRMDKALAEQDSEIRRYLLASRHAQARLADQLFQAGRSTVVSLESVMRSYRDLLPLVDDPARQVTIRHRLADLEFARAERIMTDTAEDDLSGAIAAYTDLLAEYPGRKGNDQIYYQLARAWELRGTTDEQLKALNTLVTRYPDSEYWLEAQFRRADILFINGRYPEAEKAFAEVVLASNESANSERETDPAFLMNAHYMKGWSLFKQGDYQQALLSYIEVLDLIMPGQQASETPDQRYKTLTEDLFRVVGLSLSYLDGAETLQDLFRQVGSRPYEILVYDRYSTLLIDRERYSDAIDVFDAYIEAHPASPWAPHYHMRAIDTLERAGFSNAVPGRKAGFIESYGIYSDYWPEADPETLVYIESQLEILLPELADRHYLLAGEARARSHEESMPGTRGQNLSADEHYRRAAAYYSEFAVTFPDHPRTPERLFLLAETYMELQQWPDAIRAFERVAYDYPEVGRASERSAEAGYASVLAFREYAATWMNETSADLFALQEMQQLNRLRFANAYPQDPRAPGVYYIALQREFDQQNLDEVIPMAARLAAWQPAVDAALIMEARLLAGHSLYELERYDEAEQSYRDAIAMMPAEDARRPGILENMAASVFRQAEELAQAGQVDVAVREYLRVGAVAPASVLNANAQYDAASLLISAARWDDAITVLTGFRSGFPEHELADTVPAKLALAYRETGQWEKAGDELNRMVAMATTSGERRENLRIAAELYDQAGNDAKAIDTWRQYANSHPEPADIYMEAANRLAELYEARGDLGRRDYWLNRQMEKVDQNPEATDDRMRYLAASASATLARDALARYDSIRLTLPLNKSMVAKTDALEAAVQAYQKTASYGLSSFATEAGYQIAHIYSRLGTDLMESERPEGLSQLELAQYELLLEEQAYPFEDNAIDIHEQNIRRARDGIFDEWVRRSYESLRRLLPGRYNKPEVTAGVVHDLG